MTNNRKHTVVCQICNEHKSLREVLPAELVRSSLVQTIVKEHPDWSPNGYICLTDLNHYRSKHVEEELEIEKGELTSLQSEVVKSLREHEILTKDINAEFDRQLTFGERMADRIAELGGSWGFIAAFAGFFFAWMIVNSFVFLHRPFDPYPFILLNLILSCLAAIQAPVIMMSQNRQEDKDRMRGEHDYRINLRAELEIRHLNEKMDHLIMHQWQRLLEIQQIQMELIQSAGRQSTATGKSTAGGKRNHPD